MNSVAAKLVNKQIKSKPDLIISGVLFNNVFSEQKN